MVFSILFQFVRVPLPTPRLAWPWGCIANRPTGLNIWACEVTGPRKPRRLHGYLLQDPKHVFDEIPPNNPYLSLLAGERA
jgi:hypothetical protein